MCHYNWLQKFYEFQIKLKEYGIKSSVLVTKKGYAVISLTKQEDILYLRNWCEEKKNTHFKKKMVS